MVYPCFACIILMLQQIIKSDKKIVRICLVLFPFLCLHVLKEEQNQEKRGERLEVVGHIVIFGVGKVIKM